MTDETIIEILNTLNSGKGNCGRLVYGQIAENVFHGYFYEKLVSSRPVRMRGDEMFFIKTENNTFAGAVHWLGDHDLHWLVLPDYRRQGILVDHLKSTILPYIFYTHPDYDVQGATLTLGRPFAKYSARIAEKLGFVEEEKTEEQIRYAIHRDRVSSFTPMRRGKSDGLKLSRMVREMEQQIRMLNIIVDQFEVENGCNGNRNFINTVRGDLRHASINFKDLLRYG